MTWYAFKDPRFPPMNVAGVQEKLLTAWGFHGYATRLQAQAHPNSTNFANEFVIATMERDYSLAVQTGEQPGGPNSNLGKAFTDPGGFIAGTARSELLHGFNWQNILVRIGEVLLGIVLVGVGVARLTGIDNTVSKALKVVK